MIEVRGFIQSPGNPYKDLNYQNPEVCLERADLILDIVEEINRRGLCLKKALQCLNITRDRYGQMLEGHTSLFETDELQEMLKSVSE